MKNKPEIRRHLGHAVEFLIIVFATFSHYLLDIAPPESTGRLAVVLTSILTSCMFLFIATVKRGYCTWRRKGRWILVLVTLGVFAVLAGVRYNSNYRKLTIGLPPESPVVFLVRGTVWSPDAREWIREHPNETAAEVAFNFGSYENGRDRAWTEDSIEDARFLLTLNYVLFVVASACTLFCLGEGVLSRYPVSIGRWTPRSSPRSNPEPDSKAAEFCSCFISYSHSDRKVVRQLHDQLQARGIRCWLDEHDLMPGDRILDVVGDAIRLHDKILLCCSETSLESWWVRDEIRKAHERERAEGRDIIVPLMVDRYLLEGWEDGQAADLRSRLAADFTGWEADNAKFEEQFERVVRALRTDEGARESPPESKL